MLDVAGVGQADDDFVMGALDVHGMILGKDTEKARQAIRRGHPISCVMINRTAVKSPPETSVPMLSAQQIV